jgi:3',5'-cyclic AMP phosphodiesterase CpdA
MRTLAHISDLHFGTEIPEIVAGLRQTIHDLKPDLIIVSGDLTRRAKPAEFGKARDFLQQLGAPWIAVPGNHDIPLYDVAGRFISPLTRFETYISDNLDPFVNDEEIAVLGINTARSLTWKNGRISFKQMQLIRTRFCSVPSAIFKILVTHHPLLPPPGRDIGSVVGHAAAMFMRVQGCSPDLALAGHFHASYSGGSHTVFTAQEGSILVIQAGTATSRRVRVEKNAFNLIQIEYGTVVLAVHMWDGTHFREHRRESFRREKNLWLADTSGEVPPA